MINLTKEEFMIFLEQEVFPQLQISELNEENVEYVYEYIVENYQLPMLENENENEPFINELLYELSLYTEDKE